ncbi:MAG: hypothetical protein P4M08_02530 [Oligoflexia bacterium]|nr:hypothetical protein [Oligoflexia bacterium]
MANFYFLIADIFRMRPNLATQELRELFKARKLTYVFHANAIETSLSFISQNALISREAASKNNLPQANQYTDEIDQKHGIYGDLFFNILDHHTIFKAPNVYGPVTFTIPFEQILILLEQTPGAAINITRKNPEKWIDSEADKDKWYSNVQEFESAVFVYEREDACAYQTKFPIPDIVISGLKDGLSLDLVTRIKIEANPELGKLYTDFRYVAEKIGRREQVRKIYARDNCKLECKCRNIEAILKKKYLLPKYKFGEWKDRLGQSLYEDWVIKHSA